MTFKNPKKKYSPVIKNPIDKLATRCIISDVYQVIYIFIAKNATSTMRTYIRNNLQGYEQRYELCSEKQKKYYTFCVLRNCEERLYSAINELSNRYNLDNNKYAYLNYIISILNNDNLKYYINNKLDYHLSKQSEFIKNIRIDAYVNINLLPKFGLAPLRKSNVEQKNKFKNKLKLSSTVINEVFSEDVELFSKCQDLDEEEFKNKLQLS